MKKAIDLYRLWLIIRGALDYLNRDAGDINEVLTAQEKLHLVATMDTLETALLWLRHMVEDHFFGSSCAVEKCNSWKERIDRFCLGYEDALIEGQKCNLDVFFGWEQFFDGDEYLIYGLDKKWLLEHPEVEFWTRAEQYKEVRRFGGCVIQAHPFRDRSYIPRVLLGLNYADGIEVANSGNLPYNDAYADAYARKYNLRVIAGSDNHCANPDFWNKRALMGIETDERICSIHDFVNLFLRNKKMRLIIPEGRFIEGRKEAPQIESFWLDDSEKPVPTDIHFLD